MAGSITFVGAGPGAADLITVRGLEALRHADRVVYAGSLVNERLLEEAPAHCRLCNSAELSLEQVLAELEEGFRAGENVVRLHTGDPSLYGATDEQFRALEAKNIPFSVVPGVSSVLAAAAALHAEFTVPGQSQTLILTREAGRTPVPENEKLEKLAAHRTSLALFLSVAKIGEVAAQLRRAGWPEDTPMAVVYRASWPNQEIVRGTLADIAERTEAAGIRRQALILGGAALAGGGEPSRLYSCNFAHGYRDAGGPKPAHRKSAVFALTAHGADKAAEIASGLGAEVTIVIPERYCDRVPQRRKRTFAPGGLREVLAAAWHECDALVMVMAAGIVVRHLAALCQDKRHDPAVVVCDEKGLHAVSLLSGHQGGANRLAHQVAGITGGEAVVTTATDVHELMAFDELASQLHYRIATPETLAAVTTLWLDGEIMEAAMPEEVFEQFYADAPGLTRLEPETPGRITIRHAASGLTLELRRNVFVLGIGCRRGVAAEILEDCAGQALASAGLHWDEIAAVASAEVKREEPSLRLLAEKYGKKLLFFSKEALNQVDVPNPSPAAERQFGLHSVAEAAALLGAGENAKLRLEKMKFSAVTAAIAEVMP